MGSIGPAQFGSAAGGTQEIDTLGTGASNASETLVTSLVVVGMSVFPGSMSAEKVGETSRMRKDKHWHHPKLRLLTYIMLRGDLERGTRAAEPLMVFDLCE